MKRIKTARRRLAASFVLLLLANLLSVAGAAEARSAALPSTVQQTTVGGGSASGASCQNYLFPVTEGNLDPTVYHVWGQLCSRGSLAGQPIQLLLAGGTYSHVYWDWPYLAQTYSYVDYATARGYVTLNLDRLGYGDSDHPNPLLIDFAVQSHVVHQVVQYVRAGALGATFGKVVLNGHSMGALTAEYEAADYHDVDGLIVSGIGHDLTLAAVVFLAPNALPSELDPKFSGQPWLPGYLTTPAGVRTNLFYHAGDFDPNQNAVEDRYKATMTATEIATIGPDTYDPSMTGRIEVPVLLALGQYDGLWCTATHDCTTDPQVPAEPGFWSPAAQLQQYVAPHSGHSINLGYGARGFYEETVSWLHTHQLG